jgi:hypothetical protein
MSVISAIRSLTLNLVLFIGLVLSHHIGGGMASFSPFLIPVFAISFFVFWTKPGEVIRGPYLALLLVFIQVLGHLELASSASVSTLQMTVSHIVGIAVSYFVASNFDRCILGLFEVLGSFFLPAILVLFKRIRSPLSSLTFEPEWFDLSEQFGSIARRGPPILIAAKA